MVIVKAPTRIDLAGGTLDIWPLSVIFSPAVCVNAAIDLYAQVTAERREEINGIVIQTKDSGRPVGYPRKIPEGKKNLFDRALEYLPLSGYLLTVDCQSPRGAGLGGSSALLIALIRTLCLLGRRKMSDMEMLRLAQNMEARHLGIPTGVQDYVAALNGGVNVVENGIGGLAVERLKLKPIEIQKRVMLVYSGVSRVSGDFNWLKIKKALDGDRLTCSIFSKIAENSLKLRDALEKGNYPEAGALMGDENRLREKLGSRIVPARLKKIFAKIRRLGGHPKICGAGGGGCFIVWCEQDLRGDIASLVVRSGMEPLDYRISLPADLKIVRQADDKLRQSREFTS